MILDRMSLSEINADKFTDENGKVYVIYTVEEICEKLGCSRTRVNRLFNELDCNGFIKRERQNRTSPYRIYIEDSFYDIIIRDVTKAQIDTSREYEIKPHESTNCAVSYNNNNNNNISNNKSSILVTDDEIREQIEYDCLYCEEDAGMLNEIVMIISDVLNGMSPTVRVGKDDMPRELVAKRFRMLDGDCVMSVIWQIKRNKTKIYNMKAYLIMLLYNELETGECEIAALYALHNS